MSIFCLPEGMMLCPVMSVTNDRQGVFLQPPKEGLDILYGEGC